MWEGPISGMFETQTPDRLTAVSVQITRQRPVAAELSNKGTNPSGFFPRRESPISRQVPDVPQARFRRNQFPDQSPGVHRVSGLTGLEVRRARNWIYGGT
jgi:hypothetical protein